MRYWIWWNDLIQGPFELDELTSLKAFSEDLLVCLEDREDWLPASRVADLSSAIEQLRARRAAPRVPPPPPPKRPPSVTPMQGEFFGDPPGQQPLLDSEDDPKGPYAYRPVTEESASPPSYFVGQATMPFHFAHPPESQAATSVIEILRPRTPRVTVAPPPVIKESPVQEPEEETVPVEQEPEKKPLISLELLQEKPSDAPALEEPFKEPRRLEWLPWILGVALAIGALGTAGYWLMDRASTHSAINEANRLEPPKPPSIPVALAPNSSPLPPGADQAARENARASIGVPADHAGAPSSFQRGMQTSKEFVKKMLSILVNAAGLIAHHQAVGSAAVAPTPPIPGPTSAMAGGNPADVSRSSFPGRLRKAANRAKSFAHRRLGKKSLGPRPLSKKAGHAGIHGAQEAAGAAGDAEPSSHGANEIAAAKASQPSLPGVAPLPGGAIRSPESKAVPQVRAPDPWKGKQKEAIDLVMNKTLPKSKITIGNQARAMLQEMHEKELLHAADTGERLYLPDKLAWAALQEEGSHYRVYLNFLAWQANGERVQSRSYQFLVDLKTREVRADDAATQQDLLTQPAELTFKHNPMATDIDSILGGVDTYNKHKMQLIIVKKNGRNKEQRKKYEAAQATAQEKVKRAVIYFRRTYSEKILQNIAKAYEFADLLK